MDDLTKSLPHSPDQVALPFATIAEAARSVADSVAVNRQFGKFEVLAELGRGGMGVVFKANQTELLRTVAIKMILAGAVARPEDLLRFRTEAETTAGLNHPNIVRVHEVGEIDGCPYLCMEFIDGPSLAQRLADGPLPSKVAGQYVATMARAIQHAHKHSVLHRDLKPSNILLDAEDRPHITDFGLAKRLDLDSGQTRTGAILGTPSYMAPEQAGGQKQITGAVDIYGLGAVLYELLTGRPPFRAESPLDTILQVIDRDPAPPRLLNPNVPRDLETICLKCLEKDPRRRYASAEALAVDLEHFLAGEPITARSTNILDRIALALERSQYDVQFRAYGNMLFGFAVIVFLTELAITWLVQSDQPSAVTFRLIQWSRVLLLGLVFWRYRTDELLSANAAGRLMRSIWIGYICSCVVLGVTLRIAVGPSVELNGILYPAFAALTGLTFIILGCSYWGWCNAFGLGFYVLAFLMSLDLRWAPLEFGTFWALVLVIIGIRLRHLGATEKKGIQS